MRKLPEMIQINGRILYLTEEPELIIKQLKGEEIIWNSGIKLRDNISTDEITPAGICFYYDETLGEFVYTGLKCKDVMPIKRGDVKRGGFEVSVSGKRRGKGSSREQSPYAEQCAGIKIIIAENLDHIYMQNCINIGLLVSNDFEILKLIESKKEVPLHFFTNNKDIITKQIIEYGGLFPFNIARLKGEVEVPVIENKTRQMTIAEKIFATHFTNIATSGGKAIKPGDCGFAKVDLRFSHEYVSPMAIILFKKYLGTNAKVREPESIIFFRDHLIYLDEVITEEKKKEGLLELALQLPKKQKEFAEEQWIKLYGEKMDMKGCEAICHNKILEQYAYPGDLIIGSDSHTPQAGALGCIAFGVGTTDIANSWFTKDIRIKVPPSIKIILTGRKNKYVSAKDLILYLLSLPYFKNGNGIGKIIEFEGNVIEEMEIEERATLTNMTAEMGAFTGIIKPDKKTIIYILNNRNVKYSEIEKRCENLYSDEDAEYDYQLKIDISEILPMIALPGDPGNGVPLNSFSERIPINIAYGGSCTGGKISDMDMYAEVLIKALQKGKRVNDKVKFFIQFGSEKVKEYANKRGYIEIFNKSGAIILEPGCGACINAGPGVSLFPTDITVSSQNRNFPGRSGPGKVYLSNPYVVAAAAVFGYIGKDILQDL